MLSLFYFVCQVEGGLYGLFYIRLYSKRVNVRQANRRLKQKLMRALGIHQYASRFAFFDRNQSSDYQSASNKSFETTSGLEVSSTENTLNSQVRDITFTKHPGIYEILDANSGKSYYGETDCLSSRWSRHWNDLVKGIHHNSALLKAFQDTKNPDDFRFRFRVLEWGIEWNDKKKHLTKEAEYIQQNSDRCFNVDQTLPSNPITIKPFIYKGERFESTRDAAKKLNRSRSQIKRDLSDSSKPDCYYLESEVEAYGEILIFAQKGDGPSVLFQSIEKCVQAGYATNIQNARRKIQRNEPGWRYAAVNDENKPIRKQYTLKSGELSYEMIKP